MQPNGFGAGQEPREPKRSARMAIRADTILREKIEETVIHNHPLGLNVTVRLCADDWTTIAFYAAERGISMDDATSELLMSGLHVERQLEEQRRLAEHRDAAPNGHHGPNGKIPRSGFER
jgi:hypothetical protein